MKTVELGEVCEVVSGATPKTGDAALWGGDIPWVTPKDLSDLDGMYIGSTPRTITERGLRSCSSTLLPARSVLLSSRAPIGHVAINTVPMATNQGFKSLIPKAGVVHPEYLAHWLKSSTETLQFMGNGATFKELPKSTVERIAFPLPPIEEQRRIAAILDKADALRAKRRAALAHLDSLTQSIFLDMFGDSSRAMTVEAVMERIVDYRGKSPHKTATGVPLITARVVKRFELQTPSEFIAEANYSAWMRRGLPKRGDVVFTTEAPLGEVAQIEDERVALAQRVLLLRPHGQLMTGGFLMYALRSPEVRREIEARSTGSTVRGIRQSELRKVVLPVPELVEQELFTRRLDAISATRRRCVVDASRFDDLVASLQKRAFSGAL